MRKILHFVALFACVLILPVSLLADSNRTVFGLTSANTLVQFHSNNPSDVTAISLTGLGSGEDLVGIDFRPANGGLYGISLNGTSLQLYTIDTTTGELIAVGSPNTVAGTTFGMDFNPVVDRIRIVSESDENIRLNPDTGAVAGTDTTLAYDAGDANNGANPNIDAVAYTNNFSSATVTTLLGTDSTLGILVRIGGPNGSVSPNGGVITSLGSLGLTAPLTNIGFDVVAGKAIGSVFGLVVATESGDTLSKLYSLDIAGGNATLIGSFPSGTTISDIAISETDVVLPMVVIQSDTSIKAKKGINKGVKATIGCSEACDTTLSLTLNANQSALLGLSNSGAFEVGTGTLSLPDAGQDEVTILLSGEAKSAFTSDEGKEIPKLKLLLTVTATDLEGNEATQSLKIDLLRPMS